MPQSYKDAVARSSKKKALKRHQEMPFISLHAQVEMKKAKGEWVGPSEPLADDVTAEQKAIMDQKVAKAIATAPWRK